MVGGLEVPDTVMMPGVEAMQVLQLMSQSMHFTSSSLAALLLALFTEHDLFSRSQLTACAGRKTNTTVFSVKSWHNKTWAGCYMSYVPSSAKGLMLHH